MKQISREEAIVFYQEFTKSMFSSINFSVNKNDYSFSPSKVGIGFLNVAFIAALVLPHYLFFIGKIPSDLKGNVLYVFLAIVSIAVVWFLSRAVPSDEVFINTTTQEISLKPKDVVGKFLKKPLQFKIADLAEIKSDYYTTKHGKEANIVLVLNDGNKYNAFAVKDYDNVSKVSAAFSAIIQNKVIFYDDSKEPSVIFDEKLKKISLDTAGETSYLPMIVLLFTLFVLFAGIVLSIVLGKTKPFIAEIDSLFLLKLKILGIALAVYAVPLYFASNTPFQKKANKTKSTVIFFGVLAIFGFYISTSILVIRLNRYLDSSVPVKAMAQVLETHYEKNKRNYSFFLTLKLDGFPNEIEVYHDDVDYYKQTPSQVEIKIHKGYFNKRWLKLEH